LHVLEKSNGRALILAKDDDADPLALPTDHVIECLPIDLSYLPRKATISLPRKNDGTANSIFNPIAITLYPSTFYPCTGNLGGLLVTVREAPGKLVRGAVVTLKPNGNAALAARSISNAAGEALLIVKGAAVVQYAAGTHTETINATVEILVDAGAGKRIANSPEAIAAARSDRFMTDPDEILRNLALVPISSPVSFRAGRIQSWPPP
jgi:hypothetical protein